MFGVGIRRDFAGFVYFGFGFGLLFWDFEFVLTCGFEFAMFGVFMFGVIGFGFGCFGYLGLMVV